MVKLMQIYENHWFKLHTGLNSFSGFIFIIAYYK